MITLSRNPSTKLFLRDDYFVGKFQAMGSPCEILVDTQDDMLAANALRIAFHEAKRIEEKWSRYIPGNIVDQINTSNGRPVAVDEETARLIEFANQCTRESGGLFDITTGTDPALAGWGQVSWDGATIRLVPGMRIDLGGLGKEYAVDRAAQRLRRESTASVLVNFGGDLAISRPRAEGRSWSVGIEDVDHEGQAIHTLQLTSGAVATSGSSKRGGHILDPRTGRAVEGAPQSVTVAADTCSEAGFLTTLAILNGKNARSMLASLGVPHWCY